MTTTTTTTRRIGRRPPANIARVFVSVKGGGR